MISIMNHLILLIITGFVQSCLAVQIKEISGSYQFGPDISRLDACHKAVQVAKTIALERYSSEFLLSDKEIRCLERKTESSDCSFTRILSAQYSSEILSFKKESEEIKDFGDYQVCTVYGKVWIDNEKYDPNFYLTANLNQATFRDGENVIFKINTNSKMCINIFHAAVNHENTNLKKIFPNLSTKDNYECYRKGSFFIPSSQDQEKWGIRIRYDSLKKNQEYFFIIASKKRIHWLDEYQDISELMKQFIKISSSKRYHVSLPLLIHP